jgi:hypothetical protein
MSYTACIFILLYLPCACLIGARRGLSRDSTFNLEPLTIAPSNAAAPSSIICNPALGSSNADAALAHCDTAVCPLTKLDLLSNPRWPELYLQCTPLSYCCVCVCVAAVYTCVWLLCIRVCGCCVGVCVAVYVCACGCCVCVWLLCVCVPAVCV